MNLDDILAEATKNSRGAKYLRIAKKVDAPNSPGGVLTLIQQECEKWNLVNITKPGNITASTIKRFLDECKWAHVEWKPILVKSIKEWKVIGEYLYSLCKRYPKWYNPFVFNFAMFYLFRGHIIDLIYAQKDSEYFGAIHPHFVLRAAMNEESPADLMRNRCKISTCSILAESVKIMEVIVGGNGKYLYPWDDVGFNGSSDDKKEVYSLLKSRGYPIEAYSRMPSEEVCKDTLRVLRGFEGINWILLIGNRSKILTHLAYTIPISYALTNSFTALNIDNIILEEVFTKQADESILTHARRTNILVYNDIQDSNRKLLDFRGSVAALLKHRSRINAKTLFILYSDIPVTSKSMATHFMELATHMGNKAVALIKEHALVMDMHGDEPTVKIDRGNK